MKIALLLYGQPRFLNNPKSGQGIKAHILDKYGTDVFGHVWSAEKYIPSTWTNLGEIPGIANLEEKLLELYPCIHLDVEEPKDFGYDEVNVNAAASHLYSMQKVGKLLSRLSNPVYYDYIILTRYDLHLHDLQDISEVEKGFYCMQDHPGIADQLFVFTPEYFEFLNAFDNYDEIRKEHSEFSLELFKKSHFERSFLGQSIKRVGFNLSLIRHESD